MSSIEFSTNTFSSNDIFGTADSSKVYQGREYTHFDTLQEDLKLPFSSIMQEYQDDLQKAQQYFSKKDLKTLLNREIQIASGIQKIHKTIPLSTFLELFSPKEIRELISSSDWKSMRNLQTMLVTHDKGWNLLNLSNKGIYSEDQLNTLIDLLKENHNQIEKEIEFFCKKYEALPKQNRYLITDHIKAFLIALYIPLGLGDLSLHIMGLLFKKPDFKYITVILSLLTSTITSIFSAIKYFPIFNNQNQPLHKAIHDIFKSSSPDIKKVLDILSPKTFPKEFHVAFALTALAALYSSTYDFYLFICIFASLALSITTFFVGRKEALTEEEQFDIEIHTALLKQKLDEIDLQSLEQLRNLLS